MRLYSRTGATAVDDPEYGHFDVAGDGTFDLPEPLGTRLRRFHTDGQPMWETMIERNARLHKEERERRQDPETLLTAVEALVAAAKASQPAPPAPVTDAPAPPASPLPTAGAPPSLPGV